MDKALKRPRWLKGDEWHLMDKKKFIDLFVKGTGWSREDCGKLFMTCWLTGTRTPDDVWDQIQLWRTNGEWNDA